MTLRLIKGFRYLSILHNLPPSHHYLHQGWILERLCFVAVLEPWVTLSQKHSSVTLSVKKRKGDSFKNVNAI